MRMSLSVLTPFLQRYSAHFRSTALYLGSSLFAAVTGIIINPFLAKNLSPQDYAIIGYFSSFTQVLLPLLNFSLIAYYLRHYYKLPMERRQVVADTVLLTLVVYGFLALLGGTLAFYWYWRAAKVSFPFYPYALLTFAPVYFNNALILFQVNCRLRREAARYATVTIASGILGSLLSLLLVVFYKHGAAGRLTAALLAAVLTAAYCVWKMFGKLQFDSMVVKDALRFGWPLSASALLWYFLTGVDRALLEKLGDPVTFGYYNVGAQIAAFLTTFYTAIAQTLEPDFYKALAEDNRGKLAKIFAAIVMLNAVPNLVFIAFAPTIIGLLTYNRYREASGFAQILALKNITIAFYYEASMLIVGLGFTKTELALRALGAAGCFAIFASMIGRFGFLGAAWAHVLCFVFMGCLSLSVLGLLLRRKARLAV